MKTKEQVIQEAYGEYWDEAKNYVDENGWCDIKSINEKISYDIPLESFNSLYPEIIRPKSLQGIENNNGWIKIESEDDLPKVSGDYFFISKLTNRIVTSYFMDGSKVAYNKTNIVKQYSHYKTIEKPKPPIY